MKKETLELLCAPGNGYPLYLQITPDGGAVLCEPHLGKLYPIENGIPNFLHLQPISGFLSSFYNVLTKTAIRFMGTFQTDVRQECLCELEFQPGLRVLEVCTGTNSASLLPREAHYFALGTSPGQIKKCHNELKITGRQAELFLGNAEHLPFRDNVFDVVFHMSSTKYFFDPALALQEMTRVAKPGTKIVVVDETACATKKLSKIPVSPELFLPDQVEEIERKELSGGRLQYVSFRKPKRKAKRLATVTSLLERRILQGKV